MEFKHYNPTFEYERIFDDWAWPWAGHKRFAYDLVANIKPGKIVELGTQQGTSLWSFSQAVKDMGLNTTIHAIDTWKGEKHSGLYGERVFKTVRRIRDACYPDQGITLMRKTFDEALPNFEDGSIDLLHIDGLHTYEAVKRDFSNWLPKMKPDGIILMHDIEVMESDFGVYRLWDKLKDRYATVELSHSFGLGILFLDGELGHRLKANERRWQMRYSYLHEMRRVVATGSSGSPIVKLARRIIRSLAERAKRISR